MWTVPINELLLILPPKNNIIEVGLFEEQRISNVLPHYKSAFQMSQWKMDVPSPKYF